MCCISIGAIDADRAMEEVLISRDVSTWWVSAAIVSSVSARRAGQTTGVTVAKWVLTTGARAGFTSVTLALQLACSTAFHAVACSACWARAVIAKVATVGGTTPSEPAVAAWSPAVYANSARFSRLAVTVGTARSLLSPAGGKTSTSRAHRPCADATRPPRT